MRTVTGSGDECVHEQESVEEERQDMPHKQSDEPVNKKVSSYNNGFITVQRKKNKACTRSTYPNGTKWNLANKSTDIHETVTYKANKVKTYISSY
jgi:hypothetical protein